MSKQIPCQSNIVREREKVQKLYNPSWLSYKGDSLDPWLFPAKNLDSDSWKARVTPRLVSSLALLASSSSSPFPLFRRFKCRFLRASLRRKRKKSWSLRRSGTVELELRHSFVVDTTRVCLADGLRTCVLTYIVKAVPVML